MGIRVDNCGMMWISLLKLVEKSTQQSNDEDEHA